jgi:hypothetical protein
LIDVKIIELGPIVQKLQIFEIFFTKLWSLSNFRFFGMNWKLFKESGLSIERKKDSFAHLEINKIRKT